MVCFVRKAPKTNHKNSFDRALASTSFAIIPDQTCVHRGFAPFT